MGNYDFELDLETRNTMSLINGWIREKSRVLEFGPANGRLTKYLHTQKKCSVTIVEINEEDGAEAAKYADESYLGKRDGDIENYIWKETEKKFDYIILADVLEHLKNPGEVLTNCSEVLKDDGKILVSIPNIAHNSILIDLYNDNFNYDETGLLDRTHIHFFTHTSFLKMLKGINLFVYKTEPIYSRVGNNEIANTYFDIPTETNCALRKRNTGSIYQYVFMLGKEENKKDEAVVWNEIDKFEEQESTCLWVGAEDRQMERERSVSQIYIGRGENTLVFELPNVEEIKKIRWDPLEYSGVISVSECKAELKNGEIRELQFLDSNATWKIDQLFYFNSSDPMLYFGTGDKNYEIKRVFFKFRLLKYRIDENDAFFCDCLSTNFNKLQEDEKGKTEKIQKLYQDIAGLRKEIGRRNKDIEKLREVLEHQDKDIAEQKKIIEENRKLILIVDTIRHPIIMLNKMRRK